MAKIQINACDWKFKAQTEINEPSDPQLAVSELRALVKGVPLLKSRLDDEFMLKFLRAKKFRVNKSFKLIKNYYEAKQKYPVLFNLSIPSKYKAFLDTGAVFMLPNRDEHGRKIFVFRIEKALPDIKIEDVFKINLMSLEVASEETDTQLAGLVVIADLTGFEWQKHYQYLSPYIAKKSAEVVQNNFPLRFQGFHFINEPLCLYTVYSIIKPFLKEKIRRRVHFHGNNFNSLHKHVNPNILPKYLEGTLEFDPITWIQNFLSKEKYFEDMGQCGFTC